MTANGTDRLLSRGGRRILGNTGWLIAERVLQMGLGLLIGVWVARYLGREKFGDLSCAIALVALVAPFSTLGVQSIAVRDIVRNPASRGEILGTSLILRLVGGVAGCVAVLVAAAIVYPTQPIVRLMAAIVSIGLLFRALETIDTWFQAQVQSKYTVWAKTTAMIGSAGAKVWLILAGAPVVAFAWVTAAEVAVGSLALVLVYHIRGHRMRAWRFTSAKASYLLGQSWPLILSSVGATLNLEIDKVMLGRMVGSAEAGVYTAAAKLSESWFFIPLALAGSVFPAMIRSKELGEKLYNQRMQRLFDTMVWMALAIAVVVSPLARPIIGLLYGREYAAAAPILKVHVWACLFTFMGAALSRWLVNEGLLTFSFTRHAFGAAANIALNLFLIPRYGGLGAAFSTLISYATAHWLACFTSSSTRGAGVMMSLALVVPARTLFRLAGRRQ